MGDPKLLYEKESEAMYVEYYFTAKSQDNDDSFSDVILIKEGNADSVEKIILEESSKNHPVVMLFDNPIIEGFEKTGRKILRKIKTTRYEVSPRKKNYNMSDFC